MTRQSLNDTGGKSAGKTVAAPVRNINVNFKMICQGDFDIGQMELQ